MNPDGYCSDAAVAMSTRRRRRREMCRSFTCISPWFIFWRLSNGKKSRVSSSRFMERNWGQREKIEELYTNQRSGMVKEGSRNHEATPSWREDEDVTENGKEASFNIGVGIGLIYLVRNELNKMVELRKRIELLLQNFQTEFQNQETNPLFVPSKSRISSSLPSNEVQETQYAEEHDSAQYLSSHDGERPGIGFGSYRYYNRGERSLRMDQVEAELEAEFDHMQLQMDAEFFTEYSKQRYSEANEENNAPELRHNVCLEEDGEVQEWSHDEFCGVCPRELESKLHQLLEERQQDRINELESALDYAMQQLDENERELSWWRDTARNVFGNLPVIPGLLRQVKKASIIHCKESGFEVRERGESVVKNSICM